MKSYVWGVIILAIIYTASFRNVRKWILADISSLSFFIITTTFTTLSALIYLLASQQLDTLVNDIHHLTTPKLFILILFSILSVFVGIKVYNAIRMESISIFSSVRIGAGLLLTIIIAIIFLGERPTLIQYVGMGLIIAGIFTFLLYDKKNDKKLQL